MLLNNAVLMFIRDGGLNDGKIFKKSGPVYLSIGGSVLLSAIVHGSRYGVVCNAKCASKDSMV